MFVLCKVGLFLLSYLPFELCMWPNFERSMKLYNTVCYVKLWNSFIPGYLFIEKYVLVLFWCQMGFAFPVLLFADVGKHSWLMNGGFIS